MSRVAIRGNIGTVHNALGDYTAYLTNAAASITAGARGVLATVATG